VKLLGDSHKNYSESRILTSQLKIKVEPGFIETMSCVDEHIGYEEIKKLRKHHPRLDGTYTPIFDKELLAENYKVVSTNNLVIKFQRFAYQRGISFSRHFERWPKTLSCIFDILGDFNLDYSKSILSKHNFDEGQF